MVELERGPKRSTVRGTWERYWYGESSLVRLAIFRIVMAAAAFYALFQFRMGVLQHADGLDLDWVRREWRPIYLLELLQLQAPGPRTARVVFWLLYFAILALMVGWRSRLSACIVAPLLTYWIAIAYSFGKPHHDCIALVFGLWALPLAPLGERIALDRFLAQRRNGGRALPTTAASAQLPLRLTALTIVFGYFFAGCTKLAVSGLEYLNGYSLQAHMLSFDAPWSAYFSQHVALVRWMTIGLVGIQVLFPLVLFLPRSACVFLPLGIFFHLIAWATMDTGPFLTLWFPYAAFLPWEKLPELWQELSARAGKLLSLASLALAASAICGIALIYFRFFPPIAFVGIAGALLLLGLCVRAENDERAPR